MRSESFSISSRAPPAPGGGDPPSARARARRRHRQVTCTAMFIQDTLRQFVSHTHHSRRTWLATHSPATRMQSESRHRHTARARAMSAPAGGARSPLRLPHGSGPVSVIVAHMSPVPDAFPARALPRSGSNRCVLRQPSTWRVASGSILAISMRSRSSPRRAHAAKPRVGLEALLASLCVRLRAVRRHGEPRQQHLLA